MPEEPTIQQLAEDLAALQAELAETQATLRLTQETLAAICLPPSGSRPPRRMGDVVNDFWAASTHDRWKILLYLVMDNIRKSAYVFMGGHGHAREIVDRGDLPGQSPPRAVAASIVGHEDHLHPLEIAGDYHQLVIELAEIIDRDLKTPERRQQRQTLLDELGRPD